MSDWTEFECYVKELCEPLGRVERHVGLRDYTQGLLLPIERKSVEPLAAHTDPDHVSAKHQALHHFVSKSDWSDEAVLAKVRGWVLPELDLESGCYWIMDDPGFPKKGQHSVGVAHQYCGQLGKQANCQVAVSLSVQWRLYLPEAWANDPARRAKAGVPADLPFATKPQIALEQIRATQALGLPAGIVLADAAYGTDTVFRETLTAWGLIYAVGLQSIVTVWEPGHGPSPPKLRNRTGRPLKRLRRAPDHRPVAVKALAESLPPEAWQTVTWREAAECSSRFAAVRVQAAHRERDRTTMRPEEWLLIEWPEGEQEPTKYWLSTLPVETGLERLVAVAKGRWRIERDYEDLKQEFGLGHFEGRGWRGFHHHATLCIAAYGFLVAQRLRAGEKNPTRPEAPALPEGYLPRGHRAAATPRARFHRDPAASPGLGPHRAPGPLPPLRPTESADVTQ